jgi:hypothetical protein
MFNGNVVIDEKAGTFTITGKINAIAPLSKSKLQNLLYSSGFPIDTNGKFQGKPVTIQLTVSVPSDLPDDQKAAIRLDQKETKLRAELSKIEAKKAQNA